MGPDFPEIFNSSKLNVFIYLFRQVFLLQFSWLANAGQLIATLLLNLLSTGFTGYVLLHAQLWKPYNLRRELYSPS